jgi:energy-coupling factor transporter transmembrane protein EcfT
MTVRSKARWPHRRTLLLTSIALLLLAVGSMESVGWISQVLAGVAVLLVVVAAARLWWFWRWPRGPSGSPES